MRKEILRRIKELEKSRTSSRFTVRYRDGTTKEMRPDSIIPLILNAGDDIQQIEEHGSGGNGLLCELLNGLLTVEGVTDYE